MNKKIFLTIVSLYQILISPILKTLIGPGRFCRYEITCSQYARLSIEKYGVIKGTKMAIKRLASCQPFYNAKGDKLSWV